MPSRRIQRLNEQLRREISEIVQWDVKDPRVGPATITRVETTSDLSHAKVWVLISGPVEERGDTLEGLEKAAPFVRSALASRLDVRKVPALHFLPDRSMEHAARIEHILEQVLPEDDAAEEPGDGQRD